jgi:DNA-binding SARP family transcriptional activator/DNA-binding MarR family transcriptional regulator
MQKRHADASLPALALAREHPSGTGTHNGLVTPGDGLQLGLLGPLTLHRGACPITPSAPKLRQVLSLLALQANSVTRVDQLVEELWEESPPPSALTTVQTYIYQLRKLLKLSDNAPEAGGDDPVLLSHPGGYLLQLRSLADIDAFLFEQLAERGRQELLSGQVQAASDTLRGALALWRGAALEGVATGPLLYAQVTRLEERKRTVLGLRIEADLQLGRHQEITGELASLVSAEPTREDFSAKLMLALYRCGRRADALQVYQRIRTTLVEELGLDPAAELQRLHQLMLAADPELDLPKGGAAATYVRPPTVTPAQLPPEIPDFVGRRQELDQVERILTGGLGQGLRVVNVVGRPGIGKSTFAVHAARAVRSHFPDGQLYVDLQGNDGKPQTTGQVLVRLLKAVGADENDLPTSSVESALLFRSLTADRRMLMVLDDARSAEALQHLLPGGSGCAVVVTSRVRMGGLPGAVYLKLPVLTAAESIELLSAVIGAQRVDQEAAAARALAELADWLPLALRAIATRLAARQSWPLSKAVERLRDEHNRLAELRYGGFDVSARLSEAYQLLSARQRWVFRRLAADGEALTVSQVAERVGMSPPAVETVVDELVDADLVEERAGQQAEPQLRVPALIRLVGMVGVPTGSWWTGTGTNGR